LNNDFAYSIVPNSRNGGLISLAAAAIALGNVIIYNNSNYIYKG